MEGEAANLRPLLLIFLVIHIEENKLLQLNVFEHANLTSLVNTNFEQLNCRTNIDSDQVSSLSPVQVQNHGATTI